MGANDKRPVFRPGRPPKPRMEWNDPDIQIQRSERCPKIYRNTADRIEKRQKGTIRRLNNRVKEKRKIIKKKSDVILNLRARRKVIKKDEADKIVQTERLRRKRAISRVKKKVNAVATKMVATKIKTVLLQSSRFVDGVLAFPIIKQYCKENNINHTVFSLFVILNYYEWFLCKEGLFYGFSQDMTRKSLNELVKRDLVQKVKTGVRLTYSCTDLGRATFEDYKKYHDEKIEKMVADYKKTFDANKHPFEIKKLRRAYGQKKRYEVGDKGD